MQIKHVLFLVACVVVTGIILLLLKSASKDSNTHKNGFERKFYSRRITKQSTIQLETEPVSILGSANDQYYFLDENWDRLITTDLNLEKIKFDPIETRLNRKSDISFILSATNDKILIFQANDTAVTFYNYNTKKVNNYIFKEGLSKVIPISKWSFIARTADSTKTDRLLKKFAVTDSLTIKKETRIAEKLNDGGISTDGFLYYDRDSQLLCYTFLYRNGIVLLDTNLNIIRSFRTIDTTSVPQVVGKQIRSDSIISFALTTPPKYVNMKGCVSNGKLFLRSALKADNEKEHDFQLNSIIDIYRIFDGAYIESIYLPGVQGKRANCFRVFNSVLVALYGKLIVLYRIDTSID